MLLLLLFIRYSPPIRVPASMHAYIKSLRRDLDDCRAGSNCLVGHGGVATGQDNVALTCDGSTALGCSWDGNGEAAVDGGGAGRKKDTY